MNIKKHIEKRLTEKMYVEMEKAYGYAMIVDVDEDSLKPFMKIRIDTFERICKEKYHDCITGFLLLPIMRMVNTFLHVVIWIGDFCDLIYS